NGHMPDALRSNFFGAFENGPEYPLNPQNLLINLRKILEARQVQIIETSAAFKVHENRVLTETIEIRSAHIVLALNGYFPQFHDVFKDLITPRRAQMLAVELDERLDCPGLYYDPEGRVYWRKSTDKVL